MKREFDTLGGLEDRLENGAGAPSRHVNAPRDTPTHVIARMRQTDYANKIVDVRFICKPAAGDTLHVNVIDHGGKFHIDCLACSDVTPLVDALAQVFEDHGLTVERRPEVCIELPETAWREGV